MISYDNIFLKPKKIMVDYKYKNKSIPNHDVIMKRDRFKHGNMLIKKIEKIRDSNKAKKVVTLEKYDGFYLDFESSSEFNLEIKSLESNKSNIRLMNVRYDKVKKKQMATVFIPKGKENILLNKINDYCDKTKDKNGKYRNAKLVESINDIKKAVIESFWIGDKTKIPCNNKEWCEFWLRSDLDEDIDFFKRVCKSKGIKIKNELLKFPERSVTLVLVNRNEIELLIDSTNLVAEIRKAIKIDNFFYEIDNYEQIEWSDDVKSRCIINDSDVYVSILDHGVNNKHILLRNFLNDEDVKVYDKSWDINDNNGHGTNMAGVVTYGNLEKKLVSNDNFEVNHRLESMKILPDEGSNDRELYGAITIDAVSTLYIENPKRKRIICMAVTDMESESDNGIPTSWSAAIDESASGYIDKKQKLYIISAGNTVYREKEIYPDKNTISAVESPGQAWNCITVGAFTEKDRMNFENYGLRETMAKSGALSPYSRTSMLYDRNWPIKPEVVFEGGNLLKDGENWFGCEELSVLTLDNNIRKNQFTCFNGTSSATAFASEFAAKLQARYKDAWPETIRGLMIHSAEWTPEMENQFKEDNRKISYRKLLRTCGYGVPNFDRAIKSVENDVNLIIQSEIQPYKYENKRVVFNQMDIHEIPWPKDTLSELFDEEVEVKITLSYFIEPGPGEIGWKNKYRYPSCGLRFDMNGASTKEELMAKLSKAVELDDDTNTSSGISWKLGANNRNVGSIHSDSWTTTASELINSNFIAIYPITGWWKERTNLEAYNNKIRYSLIVSLKTKKEETSLYTEIINKIDVETKIKNVVEIEI